MVLGSNCPERNEERNPITADTRIAKMLFVLLERLTFVIHLTIIGAITPISPANHSGCIFILLITSIQLN